MTRRERAAMALALEVLRSFSRVQDGLTLTAGDIEVLSSSLVEEAALALAVGLSGLTRPLVDTQPEWGRLIRVRLALYLRARLRADRGERGPCEHGIGARRVWLTTCPPQCFGGRRITPLWQQAPAHGARRTKND